MQVATATGRIAQFLRHMAALQLLGIERRPEASPEGPREAGIGQRRGCPIALHTQWGARIPLRGRTFLRKAPLRPARSHSASLRLALHPKNRTLPPVQLPDLGSLGQACLYCLYRLHRWSRVVGNFLSACFAPGFHHFLSHFDMALQRQMRAHCECLIFAIGT